MRSSVLESAISSAAPWRKPEFSPCEGFSQVYAETKNDFLKYWRGALLVRIVPRKRGWEFDLKSADQDGRLDLYNIT